MNYQQELANLTKQKKQLSADIEDLNKIIIAVQDFQASECMITLQSGVAVTGEVEQVLWGCVVRLERLERAKRECEYQWKNIYESAHK